jgi:hypothetical protein
MSLKLYATCFVIALIGQLLFNILKIKSIQDKAAGSKIEFNVVDYFKKDWLSILASMITVILLLMCLDSLLKWKPEVVDYIKPIFAFVGYTGSDIASRIFGVMNKRINEAISYKSDIANAATGTDDIPTPAAPPAPKNP